MTNKKLTTIFITLISLTSLLFSLAVFTAKTYADTVPQNPTGVCPANHNIPYTLPGAPKSLICVDSNTPANSDGTCPTHYHAGTTSDICVSDGIGGPSSGGSSGSSGKDKIGFLDFTVPDLGQLVSSLYVIALFASGLFFLIQLTVGGISWMGAGGDPKALQAARARIMNAMIGLVIVVAAFVITTIILAALGINIFSGEEIQISPPSI